MATLIPSVFIGFSSFLKVMRACIINCDEFEFWLDPTADYGRTVNQIFSQ